MLVRRVTQDSEFSMTQNCGHNSHQGIIQLNDKLAALKSLFPLDSERSSSNRLNLINLST